MAGLFARLGQRMVDQSVGPRPSPAPMASVIGLNTRPRQPTEPPAIDAPEPQAHADITPRKVRPARLRRREDDDHVDPNAVHEQEPQPLSRTHQDKSLEEPVHHRQPAERSGEIVAAAPRLEVSSIDISPGDDATVTPLSEPARSREVPAQRALSEQPRLRASIADALPGRRVPHDPVESRQSGEGAAIINVSIGRIQIEQPAPVQAAPMRERRSRHVSLDDYLSGGKRG